MQNKIFILLMRTAAITGNILFILWVTYNGVKEGFSGTMPQKASYIGLMCLLALNSYLVITGTKQKTITN